MTLHGLTFQQQEDSCDAAAPVPEARAKHLDAMIAALHAAKPDGAAEPAHDLAQDLAANMASYLARPAVDASSLPPPDHGPLATR